VASYAVTAPQVIDNWKEFASSFSAPVHDPDGLLPRNRDSWPGR
jgi:hypothetical protein